MVMKNRKDIKEQIKGIEESANRVKRKLSELEEEQIKVLRWVLNK